MRVYVRQAPQRTAVTALPHSRSESHLLRRSSRRFVAWGNFGASDEVPRNDIDTWSSDHVRHSAVAYTIWGTISPLGVQLSNQSPNSRTPPWRPEVSGQHPPPSPAPTSESPLSIVLCVCTCACCYVCVGCVVCVCVSEGSLCSWNESPNFNLRN